MKIEVMGSNPKVYINTELLNEDWAKKIHSQTLDRLAERGGLSPKEVMVNFNKLPFNQFNFISESDALKVVERLAIKSLTM